MTLGRICDPEMVMVVELKWLSEMFSYRMFPVITHSLGYSVSVIGISLPSYYRD